MVDGAVDFSRRGAVASTATRGRAANESGAAPRTMTRAKTWGMLPERSSSCEPFFSSRTTCAVDVSLAVHSEFRVL